MTSISGAVHTGTALAQAQVQAAVAAKLLKVALATGSGAQVASLVSDAVEAVSQTLESVIAQTARELDVYG